MKSCRVTNRLVKIIVLSLATLSAPPTFADGWGCQVLLCLANPGGPEQYGQCVPPIERLWSALRHGDAFPTCDFQSSLTDLSPQIRSAIPQNLLSSLGRGTGASNTWAGGGYCREDMLYWGGPEQSVLMCRATAAINVNIDGQLYTRVWWGVGGLSGQSMTEYYGAGSTQVNYDPTKAAADFIQKQQQQNDPSGGGGGN